MLNLDRLLQMSTTQEQGGSSVLDEMRKESQSKKDVASFIRSYELKQHALKELVKIYANHFFEDHFSSTFKAAVALLVVPSLTNIYYSLRSQSLLAGIVPFAMPIIFLTNYVYFFNKEMQQYSLTDQPDAEEARKQYEIIYEFSYFNRDVEGYMSRLENYRQDEKKRRGKEVV